MSTTQLIALLAVLLAGMLLLAGDDTVRRTTSAKTQRFVEVVLGVVLVVLAAWRLLL